MKQLFLVTASALALAVSGQAWAADPGDSHDCAGVVSSGAAQALGSTFGTIVAGAAQQQLVDNFGLANCGDTSRSNP